MFSYLRSVKKDRLFLCVLLGFLLAFYSAGNFSFDNGLLTDQTTPVAGKLEVKAPQYPHTELDIRQVQVSAPASTPSLPFAGAVLPPGFSCSALPDVLAVVPAAPSQAPHKRYLSFLYPSHNFW